MKYQMRRHGKIFKVYETDTKRYLCYGTKQAQVRAIVDNLNNGGGFAGEIPQFMFAGVNTKTGFELQRGHQPVY